MSKPEKTTERVKPPRTDKAPAVAPQWGATIRTRNQATLWGPLFTLLILSDLASTPPKTEENPKPKPQVSFATASRHVLPEILTASIQMLRAHGFVSTDGVTITIHKTPMTMIVPDAV